ncbi:MAG TPA: hypothetical protein VF988_02245 [Verrucomicrobiae bacterium]
MKVFRHQGDATPGGLRTRPDNQNNRTAEYPDADCPKKIGATSGGKMFGTKSRKFHFGAKTATSIFGTKMDFCQSGANIPNPHVKIFT